MGIVHCTTCGAEGAVKRRGGCASKLVWLFSILCLVMLVVPISFGEALAEEVPQEILGLSFLFGAVGGVCAIFLYWLTTVKCCGTCSSSTVVSVGKWKKLHPEGKEHVDGKRSTRKCPACAEEILLEAMKCRFCGEVVAEAAE